MEATERTEKPLVHKYFDKKELKRFEHKVVENLELQTLRKEIADLKNTERRNLKFKLREVEEIQRLKVVLEDRQLEINQLKEKIAVYESDLSRKEVHDRINKAEQARAEYRRKADKLQRENTMLVEKLAKLQQH